VIATSVAAITGFGLVRLLRSGRIAAALREVPANLAQTL
jgi:hypothetical protein